MASNTNKVRPRSAKERARETLKLLGLIVCQDGIYPFPKEIKGVDLEKYKRNVTKELRSQMRLHGISAPLNYALSIVGNFTTVVEKIPRNVVRKFNGGGRTKISLETISLFHEKPPFAEFKFNAVYCADRVVARLGKGSTSSSVEVWSNTLPGLTGKQIMSLMKMLVESNIITLIRDSRRYEVLRGPVHDPEGMWDDRWNDLIASLKRRRNLHMVWHVFLRNRSIEDHLKIYPEYSHKPPRRKSHRNAKKKS